MQVSRFFTAKLKSKINSGRSGHPGLVHLAMVEVDIIATLTALGCMRVLVSSQDVHWVPGYLGTRHLRVSMIDSFKLPI